MYAVINGGANALWIYLMCLGRVTLIQVCRLEMGIKPINSGSVRFGLVSVELDSVIVWVLFGFG